MIVEQPNEADIRAALNRVVSSIAFTKSPGLVNFLRFVVDETLAGRGDRIKAFTVATGALGRDNDFDPQSDSIVRVEAGRLRRALACYYHDAGRGDPITIELRRGSYAPIISRNWVRRPIRVRLCELRQKLLDTMQENYRLVMLIVAVTAAVSLSVDLIGMVLVTSRWPNEVDARQISIPAISRPAPAVDLDR